MMREDVLKYDNFVYFFSNPDCCYCFDLLSSCKESGGIAMLYYRVGSHFDVNAKNEPIPLLQLSYQDMQELLKNGLGLDSKIATWVKEECTVGCSDRVPCPPSPGAMYCDFNKGDYGTCRMCRTDKDESAQTEEVRLAHRDPRC